jgi:heme a synthase
MYANEKKINNLFLIWLYLSATLIFLIIIVGGLTRLTDSGLSITKWELFTGILPPLNSDTWNFYFNEYKKIPQFKLLNNDMNLDQFKIIFYWEYFHRALARIIGLFFLIPLIYFYFTKKINYRYMSICYIIFLLIILQGIIGWFMVKSGLVNDISVSHYRLSMHLIMAFTIISMIFWLIKNTTADQNKFFFLYSPNRLPFQCLIFIIFVQIVIGALVSGLDAGKIYQTWPMMGNNYFPDDTNIKNLKIFYDFNNHSIVQFYHRNTAYLICLYVTFLTIFIYKTEQRKLYKPIKILLFFLILQIILGIFTLISGLNIFLASAHQITSVLLVFSALNLYFIRAN